MTSLDLLNLKFDLARAVDAFIRDTFGIDTSDSQYGQLFEIIEEKIKHREEEWKSV